MQCEKQLNDGLRLLCCEPFYPFEIMKFIDKERVSSYR